MESDPNLSFMEKLFHLKEANTTVRREVLAGLTTFVSMAYILFVNPQVLGAAGMDKGAVYIHRNQFDVVMFHGTISFFSNKIWVKHRIRQRRHPPTADAASID